MRDAQHVLERRVRQEDLVVCVGSAKPSGTADHSDDRQRVSAGLDRPADRVGAHAEKPVSCRRRQHGDFFAPLDLLSREEPSGLGRQHPDRGEIGVGALQAAEEGGAATPNDRRI
jgi:hypothetical protein